MQLIQIAIVMLCTAASLTAAMPVASPTTAQKVALLAAYPGHFLALGSTVNHDGLQSTSQEDSPSDVQATFQKLKQISNDMRDSLTNVMTNTVANEWGCQERVMNLLRPSVSFNWSWNNTKGMDSQQAERLQTLIRLSGYIITIQTEIKLTSAATIFQNSISTLKKVQENLTVAASQVRSLLTTFSDVEIYTEAMESKMPIGQRYLERVDASEQNWMVRYLAGLALEDMHTTFSSLEVTDSDLYLHGDNGDVSSGAPSTT